MSILLLKLGDLGLKHETGRSRFVRVFLEPFYDCICFLEGLSHDLDLLAFLDIVFIKSIDDTIVSLCLRDQIAVNYLQVAFFVLQLLVKGGAHRVKVVLVSL